MCVRDILQSLGYYVTGEAEVEIGRVVMDDLSSCVLGVEMKSVRRGDAAVTSLGILILIVH